MKQTLGITHSVCPQCRKVVPAKVIAENDDVFLQKTCPEDGESIALIWNGVDDYLATQRYVKPAWKPREFAGDSSRACPDGCGYCDRHEQHLCLPIIPITYRCNLDCPICLVDAGAQWDMTLEQFRSVLDKLIRAESQIDVLNISGGEPLLHDEILEFIDEALSRPEIVRVSISTNGLRLLDAPNLVDELKARDVVVSLQFDGFDDRAYGFMRGKPLLEMKQRILDLLQDTDITTSLTMTVAAGINDNQLGPVLDLLFSRDHIVGMMIQPLSFGGRASALKNSIPRLTIPGVLKSIDNATHSVVSSDDFVPLPCSHPTCFSLAFYLMLEDGGAISLNRLVKANQLLDAVANKVFFGLDTDEHKRLKDVIYDIWSGPVAVAPDSKTVMSTLRKILLELSSSCNDSCFDARKHFKLAERGVKSVFIHAFQDADTFDLARMRRCCNAYPQIDGKLAPACACSVFGMADRNDK